MTPVIITTYKNPERLKTCLSFVQHQSVPVDAVVVDNSEDNRLYTKGMNQGLKRFPLSPYVLILTDDCFLLEKRTIEILIQFMKDHPTCGIASPIQVNKEGYITWAGSLQSFPGGIHDLRPITSPRQTPWANGACMMLRGEMVQEIGLMDENMKFVCSDADYSLTARARGWDLWVVPEAKVIHELDGSGSFGKNKELDLIKLDDFMYFAKKWITGAVFRELEFGGTFLPNGVVKQAMYAWINEKRKLQ